MFTDKIMIICLTFLGLIGLSFAEVKNDVEPLVAFTFNKPAMFQTAQGWTADNTTGYLTNAEDILNFCKKSFPELDIRNYIEADDDVVIEAFCEGCSQKAMVRPFRCMVGPFTVVSPIVPDNCLTDQTIRPTECQTWTEWQSVATAACAKHQMKTSWSSILQPCDIGKFSGVQYVCCPSSGVSIEVINSFPAQVSEYSSTLAPADAAEDDVYVDSGNKPESEHSRYVQARAELQRKQNDEIAKIMDAWDEAQKEVDKMRAKDSDMAEKLEKKITARFQKTIDSLEEKEQTEKRQMDSVHDQKVQMELNEKKKEAVEAYMAVISNKKQATLKDILKALKHYIRVEEKDRMHAINHYQHLKQTDPTTAESSRALVAEHLRTIGLRVNRAVEMLNRVPEYKEEIQEKIKDMLEEYQGFDSLESSIVGTVVKDAEDGDEEDDDDKDEEGEGTAEDAGMSKKEEGLEMEGGGKLGVEGDLGVLESGKDIGKALPAGDASDVQQDEQHSARTDKVLKTDDEEADDDDDEGVVRLQPAAAHPNHLGASELRLEERSSLVQKQSSSASSLGALAFIIAGSIFLLAVTILGLFLWRRQAAVTRRRIKTADASLLLASQEQVHIASMQVTGYENPTYKYFEAKAVI